MSQSPLAVLFDDLPVEILEHLLSFFAASSLARLSRCSRYFLKIINPNGWRIYAQNHLFFHSVTHDNLNGITSWNERARIASRVDESWHEFHNISVHQFCSFSRKTLPVMKLQVDNGRMIVAGRSSLSTFRFKSVGGLPEQESHVQALYHRDQMARPTQTWLGRTATDDITAIAPIEGTGEFILSHVSGLLQRCRVRYDDRRHGEVISVSRYSHPKRIVQAMSAHSSGLFASASSHQGGHIALYQSRAPWQEPYIFGVKSKPWNIFLQPGQSKPSWLAVGQSGLDPLLLVELGEGGLPVNVTSPVSLTRHENRTAVYGFASPPSTSPIGSPAHTLISCCYDGTVRIHDLRRANRNPVVKLWDPMGDMAAYCVAAGGGSGYTVAAGMMRHGLVSFWDVRLGSKSNAAGRNIFGPGNDSSPVYSVEMEHDRLFAITDRRAYMLQFGSAEEYCCRSSIGSIPLERRAPDISKHAYGGLQQYGTYKHGIRDAASNRAASGLYYYKHTDMRLQPVC